MCLLSYDYQLIRCLVKHILYGYFVDVINLNEGIIILTVSSIVSLLLLLLTKISFELIPNIEY